MTKQEQERYLEGFMTAAQLVRRMSEESTRENISHLAGRLRRGETAGAFWYGVWDGLFSALPAYSATH